MKATDKIELVIEFLQRKCNLTPINEQVGDGNFNRTIKFNINGIDYFIEWWASIKTLKMAKLTKPLAVLLLFASCQSPAIVTQQKALCTYSDSHVARFEYRRTEHLNQAVTIYEAEQRNYKVGQTYVIKIICN